MIYELRSKNNQVLQLVEAESELHARLYGIWSVEGFSRALELPPGDTGLTESLRQLEADMSMSPRLPVSTPSLPQAGEHGLEIDKGRRVLRDAWRRAKPEWNDEQIELAITGGSVSA